MPRFPKTEAGIVALAERLWRGLLDNHTIFPFPPVHPILIRIKKLTYRSRHGNFLAASAAAEAATTAKDEKLADLVATAILSEITLVDQPKQTKLEYRVIALNKAGEGLPSNTVAVVL